MYWSASNKFTVKKDSISWTGGTVVFGDEKYVLKKGQMKNITLPIKLFFDPDVVRSRFCTAKEAGERAIAIIGAVPDGDGVEVIRFKCKEKKPDKVTKADPLPPWRPPQYSPEMIGKVLEYLKTCENRYETYLARVSAKGTEVMEREVIVNLPTKPGLAMFLDTTETSIDNWAAEHEDFLGALQLIYTKQKHMLMNSGLSGLYNSTIAKLILSSNHGMADRSENVNRNVLPTEEELGTAMDALTKYMKNNS